MTATVQSSKAKTVSLWVLRILLGLAFLGSGGSMIAGSASMVEMFNKINFGDGFRYFTGALEILGAIGLLVPKTTFYAACCLVALMVGAIGFHLTRLGGSPIPAGIFLLLLSLTAWLSRGTHQ